MHFFDIRRACALACLVVGLLGVGPAARAQDVAESAAQRLFNEARQLMDEKRFSEACPKLAESQRLDPASGTLLNLALCHEKQGKTASAWLAWHSALAFTLREKNVERQRIANERIAELEPRLSSLEVRLTDPADSSLWLSIDGQRMGAEAWKTHVPVDPGAHTLRYGAPGKLDGELTIEVVEPGKTLTVTLEALRDRAPPNTGLTPGEKASQKSSAQSTSQGWLLTGVSFGVAAGALASTAYLGIRANKAWTERERDCASGCGVVAVSAGQSARDFARAANVAFGVSLVGIGLGSYFLWSAFDDQRRSTGVAASVGYNELFVSVSGAL